MAVTLTTNAKNWIAQNLGIGDCMTEVAQSFTYRDSVNNINIPDSGGTAKILNRLIDSLVPYVTIGGAQYTYAALKSENSNVELVYPDDVQWVMANDSGASQYCASAATVCTAGTRRCRNSTTIEQCKADESGWYDAETCGTGFTCQGGVCVEAPDKPVTGPLEVYVGGGESCDPGSPDVTLDTSGAYAFFKSTPHEYIGVGGILVHNLHTTCRAYFAWEAKIWDGYGYTVCPTTDPIHQEINRFLAEAGERPLSLKRLDASGTDEIWGSFETLPTMEGEYTLCLSLWGNFDYAALIAELNNEGYYDKI